VLANCDILVDGRYDRAQDDGWLQYRGSRNQRVIDLPRTRAAGHIVTDPTWDEPEVIIDTDGSVYGAVNVIKLLAAETGATTSAARRCGRVPRGEGKAESGERKAERGKRKGVS
jgi:hypothetical protein